MMMWFN